MTKKKEHWSAWYPGTRRTWDDLPLGKHKDIAFSATGCEVAWPTWDAPVDCVHVGCRIRRGELPPIARLNSGLRAEHEYGWLRFLDRDEAAKVFRHVRKTAKKTGCYDLWEQWGVLVGAGISGAR